MKPFAFLFAAMLGLAKAGTAGADGGALPDLDEPPRRVVVLSWSLAEQVVELGVEPLAVADPEGYRTWVVRPGLPEAVVDVGLRQEPNLERIAELKPDIILTSDDQLSFVDKLERIAPVAHFETFSADHDNEAAARRTFRELGRLFDREATAERKLVELDDRLAELRNRVEAHFGGEPPKVAVVRFVDEARVVLYGGNSMPLFAIEALGLDPAVDLPRSKWGIAFRKVEELGRIEEGRVLWIEPFPQKDKLFARPLWRAMPFVREGRLHALPSTWTYGGAMSVGYLAEAIAEVLLSLDRQ